MFRKCVHVSVFMHTVCCISKFFSTLFFSTSVKNYNHSHSGCGRSRSPKAHDRSDDIFGKAPRASTPGSTTWCHRLHRASEWKKTIKKKEHPHVTERIIDIFLHFCTFFHNSALYAGFVFSRRSIRFVESGSTLCLFLEGRVAFLWVLSSLLGIVVQVHWCMNNDFFFPTFTLLSYF